MRQDDPEREWSRYVYTEWVSLADGFLSSFLFRDYTCWQRTNILALAGLSVVRRRMYEAYEANVDGDGVRSTGSGGFGAECDCGWMLVVESIFGVVCGGLANGAGCIQRYSLV